MTLEEYEDNWDSKASPEFDKWWAEKFPGLYCLEDATISINVEEELYSAKYHALMGWFAGQESKDPEITKLQRDFSDCTDELRISAETIDQLNSDKKTWAENTAESLDNECPHEPL